MIVFHPACDWRMGISEMLAIASRSGLSLSNRRGRRSGRSFLVLA